ncbi:MAG: aminoglycoside phosphotransferase family protein [Ruminococcaceae bacterium]|nr:aminoglycoside phosphotransferase family protein [Oscillospiraceae bacterium]
MDVYKLISKSISKNLNSSVKDISPLGNGASGSVFRVELEDSKVFAVKLSAHASLMEDEYKMLSFLKEKTESKIPRVYYFDVEDGYGMIAMEYINGIGGASEAVKDISDKEKLRESIVDNLILIHKVKGSRFGPYDNAVYDKWTDYYKGFADEILVFSRMKHSKGELEPFVLEAVEKSYGTFDVIFGEEDFLPTLIHGDYWMPNFIIDAEKAELLSVVDPFNIMWADPEYELFALSVGYGGELLLYELYKSKVKTSKYCDVKTELYALYSEILWYKKLGSIDHSFLKMRAERLVNVMKRFSLI